MPFHAPNTRPQRLPARSYSTVSGARHRIPRKPSRRDVMRARAHRMSDRAATIDGTIFA
jgi:hypothetical protein